IDLASNGVELAVRGHQLRSFTERKRREQPRDELVCVLSERDVAVGIVEKSAKALLNARRLLRRALPFLVDELRRIEPRALLHVERHVGPRLMRMTAEQTPLRNAEAGVMASETEIHPLN